MGDAPARDSVGDRIVVVAETAIDSGYVDGIEDLSSLAEADIRALLCMDDGEDDDDGPSDSFFVGKGAKDEVIDRNRGTGDDDDDDEESCDESADPGRRRALQSPGSDLLTAMAVKHKRLAARGSLMRSQEARVGVVLDELTSSGLQGPEDVAVRKEMELAIRELQGIIKGKNRRKKRRPGTSLAVPSTAPESVYPEAIEKSGPAFDEGYLDASADVVHSPADADDCKNGPSLSDEGYSDGIGSGRVAIPAGAVEQNLVHSTDLGRSTPPDHAYTDSPIKNRSRTSQSAVPQGYDGSLVENRKQESNGYIHSLQQRVTSPAADTSSPSGARSSGIRVHSVRSQPSSERSLLAESGVGGSPFTDRNFVTASQQVDLTPASWMGRDDVDWTDKFFKRIATLRQSEATHEDHAKLADVAKNFLDVAQMYGRVIISEKELPVNMKTIKPLDFYEVVEGERTTTGRAGGVKYKLHNIFFKFAVDSTGLYGNRDDYVRKAAGHELKALTSVYEVSRQWLGGQLLTPLMALIDYKGHRLIAISVLPIDVTTNSATLVYGSHDGGVNVKCSDRGAARLMTDVGEHLNLKEHWAGMLPGRQVQIVGPADLEVHRFRAPAPAPHTSGSWVERYVACDFARLFPPVDPTVVAATFGTKKKQAAFLFELLRPELVMRFHVPLCSDAFCKMNSRDPEREQNERDISKATEFLLDSVVPEFAYQLSQVFRSLGSRKQMSRSGSSVRPTSLLRSSEAREYSAQVATQDLSRWFSDGFDVLSSADDNAVALAEGDKRIRFLASLVHVAHREGINCRYLGRVRYYAHDPELRELLLLECTARACKNLIHKKMREILKARKSGLIEMHRRALLSFLNLILRSPECEQEADEFWRRDIKEVLTESFPQLLTREEAHETFALFEQVDLYVLVMRLQSVMRFELSPAVLKELQSLGGKDRFHLVSMDVISLPERTKHMNLVASAEATSLFLHSLYADVEGTDSHLRSRLFDLSMQRYASAVALKPDDNLALSSWGDALYAYYERCGNEIFFDRAVQRYTQADNASKLLVLALRHHTLSDREVREEQLFLEIVEELKRHQKSKRRSEDWRQRESALQQHDSQYRKFSLHAEVLYSAVFGTRSANCFYDAHLGLGRLLYARAIRMSQRAKVAESAAAKKKEKFGHSEVHRQMQRLRSSQNVDVDDLRRSIREVTPRAGAEFRQALRLKPELFPRELVEAVGLRWTDLHDVDDAAIFEIDAHLAVRAGTHESLTDAELCNAFALSMWNERHSNKFSAGRDPSVVSAALPTVKPSLASSRATSVEISAQPIAVDRPDHGFAVRQFDPRFAGVNWTTVGATKFLRTCRFLSSADFSKFVDLLPDQLEVVSSSTRQVSTINLRNCHLITDATIERIFSRHWLGIEVADLRGVFQLQDGGLRALGACPSIRSVRIDCRMITNRGLKDFCGAVAPTLHLLGLSHALNLSRGTIRHATGILDSLNELRVSWARKLDSDSLMEICRGLHSLQKLSLRFCLWAPALGPLERLLRQAFESVGALGQFKQLEVTGTRVFGSSPASLHEVDLSHGGHARQSVRIWRNLYPLQSRTERRRAPSSGARLEQRFAIKHSLKLGDQGKMLRVSASRFGLSHGTALAAAKLVACSHAITELDIVGEGTQPNGRVDAHCWLALCEGIKTNTGSLHAIHFRFLPALGPENMMDFAAVLGDTSVRHLAVCNVALGRTTEGAGDDEDEPFAAVVKAFPGVAFDAQNSIVVNPRALASALHNSLRRVASINFSALRFLRLDHIAIENAGLSLLCDALASPDYPTAHRALARSGGDSTGSLLEKAADGMNADLVEGAPFLTLSLEGCGITEGTPLLPVLARNACLSTLNLNSNPLFRKNGEEFARELGAALAANSCLLALALDNTEMDDVCLSALCAVTGASASASVSAAVRLGPNRCDACQHVLAEKAKFCPECGVKTAGNAAPSSSGDTDVASLRPLDTGLRELSLCGNDFARDGIMELCEALLSQRCTVRSLNLVHNTLSPMAVERLSAVIGETQLQSLILSAPEEASTESEGKLLSLVMGGMAKKCTVKLDPPHLHDRIFAMAVIRFPSHMREVQRQARQAQEDAAVKNANATSVAAIGWGAQLRGSNSKLARFMLRNAGNN